MKKQDQLKAALPMPCQNLEKLSQKADVSGQTGAVTRGASCLASTTQRSGDIPLDSSRARLAKFLSGYGPSELPESPAANVVRSFSDSPVDISKQSPAVTPFETDKSTAVIEPVISSTIEKTTLAKTCASVCLADGGSLPPPGYSQPGHPQPGYIQYVTGYQGNSCPYGMWLGGPFHMSAGGEWSSPCRCGSCGSCAPCGTCGSYVPCSPCTSCGRHVSGSCCYCPCVPNYSPNTQTGSNWSTTNSQCAPETIEAPDVPDIPETPPMTSCGSLPSQKTNVVDGDDFPDLIHGTSKHDSIPGVVCFAPEESAKKNSYSNSSPKPSFDNPLPSPPPSKNRNKPIVNRPRKLT